MERNCVKEKYISNMPSYVSCEVLQNLVSYMKSNICKITMSDEGQGTGFFCKIPSGWEEILKVLITNNHVLNDKDIIPGNIIKLTTDDDKNFYQILIDETRLVYTNYDYDITIIQLKEKDNLDKISFFDIDEFENNNYREIFRNKEIYLLHYPKGQKMNYSSGFLKQITEDKDEIIHSCNTDIGSSGGPIINTITYKVIGIHKGASNKGNFNLGTFLKKTFFLKNIN